MKEVPEGMPISEATFAQLQILGPISAQTRLIYPRREVSQFIPLFSKSQRAALNLYGAVAILMFAAGLILPFIRDNWWWLLLVPCSVATWRANRKSMEQFFFENLRENATFYEAVRARIGDRVFVFNG